jgi:hypothetical protein
MNIYYVYAYLRDKNSKTAKAGTPYYIGKGKNNRAYQQHRNGPRGVAVSTNKLNIVILEANLTEVGAFAIERRMIKWYGRKDLGTGILLNLTDGGIGAPNVKITESKRAKLVAAHLHRSPMTDKTKLKIGKAHKGLQKFTKEQKIEQSIRRKNNKWWNNGITQCFAPMPPNNSYVRGRLKFNNVGAQKGTDVNKGKRWWTNGDTQIFSKECPEGFVLGRKVKQILT